MGGKFRTLLAFAVSKDVTPQISQRKLLQIATKLPNLRNFSPSKSFPLGRRCPNLYQTWLPWFQSTYFLPLSFIGAQGYSYRTNTAPDYTTSGKEEEFTKNNWEYNAPLDTPEKPETFQYHPTTENVYCNTPCTPVPHPIPMPHYNPRSAATSPYRSMASKPQSLNLKTNFRAEEHLTNREREVYGKNIVARMPSIDTSSKTSLHLQNGHTHRLPVTFNAHGGGVVQIHDSEIGCSDC